MFSSKFAVSEYIRVEYIRWSNPAQWCNSYEFPIFFQTTDELSLPLIHSYRDNGSIVTAPESSDAKLAVVPSECGFDESQCDRILPSETFSEIGDNGPRNESSFRCDVCTRNFAHEKTFQIHKCTTKKDKGFKCAHCNKHFFLEVALFNHPCSMLPSHPYNCIHCGRNFVDELMLLNHVCTHAHKVSAYRCERCDSTFTQEAALLSHTCLGMRSGRVRKSYKCRFCGKVFAQFWNLRRHERIHTGERPFKCSECGRPFNDASNLKQHMVTHTGERPYTCRCKICGKACMRMVDLIRHERTHV